MLALKNWALPGNLRTIPTALYILYAKAAKFDNAEADVESIGPFANNFLDQLL